jgi:hypothetical protein
VETAAGSLKQNGYFQPAQHFAADPLRSDLDRLPG